MRRKSFLAVIVVALLALTWCGASAAKDYSSIMSTVYAQLRASRGSSYSGWCGQFVLDQLNANGIGYVTNGGSCNGNQIYYSMVDGATTSGGYKQIKYAGNNALYDIISANGSTVENIVISLKHQYSGAGYSDQNPGYGHTLFIYAIVNNTVYFIESFDGYGYSEGQPQIISMSDFMWRYNNYYGSIIGAVHYNKGEIITTGAEMTSGYDRTIPDGNYIIACAGNVRCYLDIEGSAVPASNESNVAIAEVQNNEPPVHDIWTVKYTGDGFYSIKQYNSDMELDLYGGSTKQDENVSVHESANNSAHRWAISHNGSNGYLIQAKCSGFYLDIEGNSVVAGANVRQYSKRDGNTQVWVFIPYKPSQPIANGRYILLSGMDNGYEIDIPGDTGEIENCANVQIWNIGAKSRYNSFDITALDNGYYRIIHVASGKSLDLYGGGTENGGNISLYDHDTDSNYAHQWAIIPYGDGFILFSRWSGYAIDVNGGIAVNGANVYQWPVHGRSNQIWNFVQAEYSVSYNANKGNNAPEKQTKYFNDNLELTVATPTRDGHNFIGWATDPKSTAPEYQPGDSYAVDADLTLYAVWQKKTYTVSYSVNGSLLEVAPQIKTYGEPLMLTKEIPIREGYTFLGWATSSNAIAVEYQPGSSYTKDADITLYAVWKKNPDPTPTPTPTPTPIPTPTPTETPTTEPSVEPTAEPTVTPTPVAPTKVKLDKSGTVKLKMGKKLTLTATLTPADAQAILTWGSSKPKYATVENGVVTPVKPGTATVTVTTDNGLTASVKVKVVAVAPKKVTLDRTGTVTLKKGEKLQLKAALTPTYATTTLTWSSSNKKVAKVDKNGKVTALKKGTATITVKTKNGKKAKVKIRVK